MLLSSSPNVRDAKLTKGTHVAPLTMQVEVAFGGQMTNNSVKALFDAVVCCYHIPSDLRANSLYRLVSVAYDTFIIHGKENFLLVSI